MSEILIRVVERCDRQDSPFAGDVITIQKDGWHWSEIELTCNEWRIIRCPLINTDYAELLKQGAGELRRARYIDTDALPSPTDFKGNRTHKIIELTRQQLISAAKLKPEHMLRVK